MPARDRRGLRWSAGPAAVALGFGCLLTAASCEAPDARRAQPPDAAPDEEPGAERLLEATDRMVAFLRGEAALDTSLVADSVTLFIAPEGGGGSRRVAGPQLQDLSMWQVGDHRLTPPPAATILARRVGRHFNCMEYPLASLYEDLARRPHVGTKLEPPGSESCLQSWNMTFVFASDRTRPIVIAVVYDQWEW